MTGAVPQPKCRPLETRTRRRRSRARLPKQAGGEGDTDADQDQATQLFGSGFDDRSQPVAQLEPDQVVRVMAAAASFWPASIVDGGADQGGQPYVVVPSSE